MCLTLAWLGMQIGHTGFELHVVQAGYEAFVAHIGFAVAVEQASFDLFVAHNGFELFAVLAVAAVGTCSVVDMSYYRAVTYILVAVAVVEYIALAVDMW